ncbi:hypothetical protein KM92DES2_12575 [uncultured Desulfovibrio sp.]|uniref:Uncharacterized protein n=1 Tax=uncultured Desulfovibrio sp. TaxID=167968 RepID=A0A212KAZ4_9BACT|nr:hypothetical protein KM92DES2_12575 [uncultured Desulfovibrio sp.]
MAMHVALGTSLAGFIVKLILSSLFINKKADPEVGVFATNVADIQGCPEKTTGRASAQ